MRSRPRRKGGSGRPRRRWRWRPGCKGPPARQAAAVGYLQKCSRCVSPQKRRVKAGVPRVAGGGTAPGAAHPQTLGAEGWGPGELLHTALAAQERLHLVHQLFGLVLESDRIGVLLGIDAVLGFLSVAVPEGCRQHGELSVATRSDLDRPGKLVRCHLSPVVKLGPDQTARAEFLLDGGVCRLVSDALGFHGCSLGILLVRAAATVDGVVGL
ncbi:MAG: putative acetyl-coenzyme A carboxylase carboxyl transferase subunit beta [Caudoviricetes sp.]|nr:MAG: putative acetyl-coenzyme A carboxylase carboxyl transferase subunit beta [Caudoviricetes sp.]